MEIFDVFSMNGIENYPAAGEIFFRKTQFFPNAIYPIWFVPDKKPVAGGKN